jgi:hypothetical protein
MMSEGRWVELEYVWHETNVVNCPVCGKLVVRRTWAFDGGAGELRVCDRECQELYEGYWRPTYGVMEAS